MKTTISITYHYFLILLLAVLLPLDSNAASGTSANNSSFWVKYIDVGQGDSTLIQCDGHYMLIDGGSSKASSVIYSILKDENIKNLDVMIATHPDADHIGGLSGALNYSTVKVCYSPVKEHDSKQFRSLLKYLGNQNVPITVPKVGDSFWLGSAKVELIGPITDAGDSNNSSIVTRVTYGNTSFLFMGDAETEEENSLINAKSSLACNVLKVAHHGSSSSTSNAFIEKVNPEIAIISVGKDNSYGHPTKAVLDRLSSVKKISLYRTDLQGDITCGSDGKRVTVTTEKTADKTLLWTPGTTDLSNDVIVPVETNTVFGGDRSIGNTGTSSYVLNTNTKKFHYPTCKSVKQMKEKNRKDVDMTRDEIISMGYDPCGNCHP